MTLRLHLAQLLPASVDFLTRWYVLLSPESFKSRSILYTCTTIKFRPEGLFLERPVKESPDYNLILSQSDFYYLILPLPIFQTLNLNIIAWELKKESKGCIRESKLLRISISLALPLLKLTYYSLRNKTVEELTPIILPPSATHIGVSVFAQKLEVILDFSGIIIKRHLRVLLNLIGHCWHWILNFSEIG